MSKREFALYKDEEIIGFGTRKDLAKLIGVKEKTIKYYSTPSHHKRSGGKGWVTVEITGWDKDE